MNYHFIYKRLINFHETDMAGILHFSNYFRIMEETESRFFSSLNLKLFTLNNESETGWPRVHVSCDYLKPIHYGEQIEAHLIIEKIGDKSITYKHTFYNEDGDKVAEGKVISTYVQKDKQSGKFSSAQIPDDIRKNICIAPKDNE